MNKPAIHERAFAKINLALDILGRRGDGYHNLDMVCETVSLFDDIFVNAAAPGLITLSRMNGGDDSIALPGEEDNLMYRAASLMRRALGISEGVDIGFVKRIPTEAGLGGGSSDAAAVMRAVNKLFGSVLSDQELERLGLKLGADVPFFIRGGTARVGGIGDKLRRLDTPQDISILLVKPAIGLSTALIYREYDLLGADMISRPDIDAIAMDIGRASSTAWAKDIGNVLECAAMGLYPEISLVKERMLDLGALSASMTGSGSAVFGIFTDKDRALTAKRQFEQETSHGVYLLKPVSDTEGQI